jgi:biopolymer transport protein ExbD
MSFSSGGSSGRQNFSDINITPLTDVFLVLLIIMILIAPMMNQSSLKIEPPMAAHGKSEQNNKTITIEVSKDGTIAINSKIISDSRTPVEKIQVLVSDAMKAEFEKLGMAPDEVPVAVKADEDARQKYVVAVLDAAAGNKVKKLRIITQQN